MAAQQIADLYGSVGFRLDKQSWANLDKFESRLDTIKGKLNNLTGRGVGPGGGGGGSTGPGGRGGGRSGGLLSSITMPLRNIHTIGLAITGGVATSAGRAILDSASKYDALRSSLLAVSGTAEGAREEFRFLEETTKRLGLVTTEISRPYINFSVSAKAAGLKAEETKQIFTEMSEASRGLNLTADDTAGVFRALGQMFAKSTVQSEELKGQLGERLPGAFSIAAKVMKMTTKELGEQLKAGNVLAKDMIPKLAKEYARLVKDTGALAKSIKSTGFVVNRFTEEWNKMLDRLGQGEAGKALRDLVIFFTESFQGMGEQGSVLSKVLAGLAISFEIVGGAAKAIFTGVSNILGLFDPALLAMIGVALAGAFSPFASAAILISGALALLEDFYGFVKGKESVIGEFLGFEDFDDAAASFDKMLAHIKSSWQEFSLTGTIMDKVFGGQSFDSLSGSSSSFGDIASRMADQVMSRGVSIATGSGPVDRGTTIDTVNVYPQDASDFDQILEHVTEQANLQGSASNAPRVD